MNSIMNRTLLVTVILTIAAPRVLPEQKQPQPQVESGVIRGVVMRLGTSEPIPGVEVSAIRGSLAAPGERESAQSVIDAARARGVPVPPVFQSEVDAAATAAAKPFTAITDSAGRFAITGLPPGRYYISGKREGYLGPEMNNRNQPFVETGATVVAGQQTPDLALAMVRGARIQGRILDSQGRPAVGVSVLAYKRKFQSEAPVLLPLPGTKTNARGEYQLPWLPPGEFYVGVEPASESSPRAVVPSGISDASTWYPGTVDTSSAQLFVLRRGEDLSGIDIALRSLPRIKVSGRVTSSIPIPRVGNGDRNAEVVISLLPGGKNTFDVRGHGASASLGSPANGQFEITGVRTGTYDLYAKVNAIDSRSAQSLAAISAGTQPAAYIGRTSIEAGSHDVSGVSVVLRPGVEVVAHVTVDGRTISTAGGAIRVNMEPADSASPVYGSVVSQIARPDGSIVMPFVSEGLYRFRILFLSAVATTLPAQGAQGAAINLSRAYVDDIREGNTSVYGGFRMDPERPRSIEVVVKTNGGSINGTVVDAEQMPKAGAMVVMVPALQGRQKSAWYKTATSSGAGRFVITGIAPGEYKLLAWESAPLLAYQDPSFLAKFEESGRAVMVNPSSTTSAQVKVIPAGK